MSIIATTNPQRIGIAVAVLLVVGWLAYILAHLRRRRIDEPPGSEIELAPNRKPYLDDEALEGPKLERSLGYALVLLIAIAIALPLYWAHEPSRQAGAKFGFDKRSAYRGFLMFQPADSPIPSHNVGHFGCATCHGSKGQGGSASYVLSDAKGTNRKVTWTAPALNTVMLRYTPDTVRTVLIYGRANTPMPAWGVAGGGPMNEQQILDLVEYLKSIQVSPDQAQKTMLEQAQQEAKIEGKTTIDGQVLFNVNCARCHTEGYSIGEPSVSGGGAYGPNLTNGSEARQFPNEQDMIDFISKGAEFGKPYGVRGIGNLAPATRTGIDPGLAMQGGGMPYFGSMLTPDQINQVVAYERGL